MPYHKGIQHPFFLVNGNQVSMLLQYHRENTKAKSNREFQMRTVEENDLPSCLKAKTISNDILITINGDNKPMLSKKMRDGRVPSPHVSHTDHLQLLVDKNEAFAA